MAATDKLDSTALMSSLTMPLTELRERVDLVERLAIASRHAVISGAAPAAPATTSAGGAASPQAGAGGKAPTAAATTKAQPQTPKADPKPSATVAAAAASDEVDLDAAFGDGSSGGDDFASELGDGGDMLEGFVPDMSPADARAAATKIATSVIGKKDTAELTTARTVMQKYSVTKVSAVPDEKVVELYTDMKKAFPQYAS